MGPSPSPWAWPLRKGVWPAIRVQPPSPLTPSPVTSKLLPCLHLLATPSPISRGSPSVTPWSTWFLESFLYVNTELRLAFTPL